MVAASTADDRACKMPPIPAQSRAKTTLLEEMRAAREEMERILTGLRSGEADAGDELQCVLQAYLDVIRQAMREIDARM